MNRHPTIDPLASLVPAPIIVTVNGRDLVIPALPALPWLKILLANDPDLTEVFPGLLAHDDEKEWVEDQLWEGTLGLDGYNSLIQEIMTVAMGRPWWFGTRIVFIARMTWDRMNGEMALAGINVEKISLGAWLDAAWNLTLKALTPQSKEDVERNRELYDQITQDPGLGENQELDEEMETEAFMGLMNSM